MNLTVCPGALGVRWPCALTIGTLGVILAFAAVRLESDAQTLPPHTDEAPWILSGLYYWSLAASGDFTSDKWERPDFDVFGSINPFLGRWWIAGVTRIFLKRETSEFAAQFSADPSRAWVPLDKPKSLVTPSALVVARRANAVLGLAALLLVFVVARQVAGDTAGILASGSVAMLEPFYLTYARVFTDSAYLVFSLAATSCLIRFLSCGSKSNSTYLAGAGVLIGCAFNVKMTALAIGLFVMGVAILLRAYCLRTKWPTVAAQIGGSGAVAIFFSIALNPYLWPSAAGPRGGGTWEVLVPMRWSSTPHAFGPQKSFAPVPIRLLEMHFRWRRQIHYQVAAWPGDATTKLRIAERLFVSYNHGVAAVPLLAATVAAGCCALRRKPHGRTWRHFLCCRSSFSREWLGLIGIATFYIGWSFVMIPLDWDRYYLPAVLHLQILEACSITSLVACRIGPSRALAVSQGATPLFVSKAGRLVS